MDNVERHSRGSICLWELKVLKYYNPKMKIPFSAIDRIDKECAEYENKLKPDCERHEYGKCKNKNGKNCPNCIRAYITDIRKRHLKDFYYGGKGK